MGILLYNWEIGLRRNFAELVADLRRHRLQLEQGNEKALAHADEIFMDTLHIASQHFYRRATNLAKITETSQSKISGWMNGHQKASIKDQMKILDVFIEGLDYALAETSLFDEPENKPQTLSEIFAAARKDHLQVLGKGIDQILSRGTDITNNDFHMVLITAQALLYPEDETKKLAKRFNTSAPNYISWAKGDSAPRTDESRREILTSISIDIALKSLEA